MDGRGRGQAASQQHIAVLYMLTVPANCSMVVGPDSESNMTKNIYIYIYICTLHIQYKDSNQRMRNPERHT